MTTMADAERRARIHAMIENFRAAKRRRVVKRAMLMWKRAHAACRARGAQPRPPTRIH